MVHFCQQSFCKKYLFSATSLWCTLVNPIAVVHPRLHRAHRSKERWVRIHLSIVHILRWMSTSNCPLSFKLIWYEFLISGHCLNLWNCKYVNYAKSSAYTQDNQTHKRHSVSIFRLRIGHWWLNIFHYYLFTFGFHPRDCVIIVKPRKQSVKFVTICSTYHSRAIEAQIGSG